MAAQYDHGEILAEYILRSNKSETLGGILTGTSSSKQGSSSIRGRPTHHRSAAATRWLALASPRSIWLYTLSNLAHPYVSDLPTLIYTEHITPFQNSKQTQGDILMYLLFISADYEPS